MFSTAVDGLGRLGGLLRLWQTVQPYQRGLRVRAGKDIAVVGPGVYWTWPVIDDIERYSVVPQINRLPPQSLMTKDGVVLFVSGVVEYDVQDVRKALREIHDVDEAINDKATKLVAQMIGERDYKTCSEARGALEDEVEEALQTCAALWGLRIRAFGFVNFAKHQVLRVVGDAGTRAIVMPQAEEPAF